MASGRSPDRCTVIRSRSWRPGAPRGKLAVARMASQSSAVRPRAWPRPRPDCLAGEALQNAADAIMGGGIVGAGITVSCADGRPDGADGGGRGALLGALGEVGGDGRRIGRQLLVSAIGGPCSPALPRAAVRAAGTRPNGSYRTWRCRRAVVARRGPRGAGAWPCPPLAPRPGLTSTRRGRQSSAPADQSHRRAVRISRLPSTGAN